MKWINLNNIVKVKLTDYGKDIFYHQNDVINQIAGREIVKAYYPAEDPNGFVDFQLHDLMNLYGEYLINGAPQVIVNNRIYMFDSDIKEWEPYEQHT